MRIIIVLMLLSHTSLGYTLVDTLYTDDSGEPTIKQAAQKAKIIEYQNLPQDSSGCVTIYKLPDFKPTKKIEFSNINTEKRQGLALTFGMLGKVVKEEHYEDNRLHGAFKTFYPSGKLKRVDHYWFGICRGGDVYSENGNKLPYYPYQVDAKYPGGELQLFDDIRASLRVPESVKRERKTRRAFINFVINTNGKVSDVEVVGTSGSDDFDKAAIQAVYYIKNWSPAMEDGIPVPYFLSLPVTVSFD